MTEKSHARRVIEVNQRIIRPVAPRPKTVRARSLGDYPSATAAHLDLAKKLSSPLLLGPPICDELIALVQHTFTEEEASLVRHLGAMQARDAARIARATHRPVEQIEPILQRLGLEKRAISCEGPPEERRYRLLPIMPGMFEMVLIGASPDSMSDWHRRFAELFEALFETGYMVDYQDRRAPIVRVLPMGPTVDAHPAALPADRLEPMLDRFDTFAVGNCQCRMTDRVVGRGCDKPLEVCTIIGPWAQQGIDGGFLRKISRQDVLQIKREAESHGLVTWIMNIESTKVQASCSCCGCCCKAMRMINDFNVPGIMAPPHFMPRFDATTCSHCGRCAKRCPTAAITVDTQNKTLQHEPPRCIGCGLCALACEKEQSIAMEPVPEYRLPYKSWLSLLLRNGPGVLKTTWKAWRGRRG